MDSKKAWKIAGNVMTVIGILGGYAYARHKFQCPTCGSWKSSSKTIEDAQIGVRLVGIPISDPVQVIKKVRTCNRGHSFVTSMRIK